VKLHLSSFVLGYAAGAATAVVAPRLRPLFLEIATGVYKLGDAAVLRVARAREDVEDLLAEARARARGLRQSRPAPVAQA
jgi:hypothetical protein